MRNVEALDAFIPIAGEANLDFILRADGEGVRGDGSSAGAVGQAGDMLFLSEVGWDHDEFAGGFANRAADGETADFLRGGKIPLDEDGG